MLLMLGCFHVDGMGVVADGGCSLELVQTVPNVERSEDMRSVGEAWIQMVDSAQYTVDMESLYVILSEGGGDKSVGKAVLKSLLNALAR